MTQKRKDMICALLKGIETGDPASIAVVHPETYIQHNPMTKEGGEGLAALFKRLAKTSPRVTIARIFSDGDYVFGHTEYDFSKRRVGFEVFRFEGDLTVEHWDNIQSRQGPNPSGRSMVDGVTKASDHHKTEVNREHVRAFLIEVLIGGRFDKLPVYVHENYREHNPRLEDGLASLRAALSLKEGVTIRYDHLHRVLAEGNFVLSVCEGALAGVHTSFYDLFRVENGKIEAHWDTVETVPPRATWQNENGKF